MPETAPPAGASASQDAEITAALGMRAVVLVGMMGAGKSTIGRRLSARLRVRFLDADIEIEAAAGMSIPDIFETHGEAYFRDGEARVIARLLDSGPAVLATGGGAFMREETRVYQHADITIWSRDVPHEKIVDECIEALHSWLCGDGTAPVTQETSDPMGATR